MDLPKEVRDLLDKQAIQESVTRYCRGVDRADPDLIASAYHPDAVDEHGAKRFVGSDVGHGIVEMTRTMRVTLHCITNMTIELQSAKEAGCECYFSTWQTMMVDGRERVLIGLGRYLDRFECREGQWKIAHRLVVVDLATLLPEANFTPARADLGCRGPADPSFALLSRRGG